MLILRNFVDVFATVLTLAIILRALLSWFSVGGSQPLGRLLVEMTEPVLAPIRRLLPGGIMIDFSPLLALVLIQVLQSILDRSLVA